jgi:hypothetical protein
VGFKLGHFMRSAEGLMKAVFWTDKEVFIYAFSPRMSESEEDDDVQIKKNRKKVILEEMDDFEIEKIFDFGVSLDYKDDYNDTPELLLLLDKNGVMRLLKGKTYGTKYAPYIAYINDD